MRLGAWLLALLVLPLAGCAGDASPEPASPSALSAPGPSTPAPGAPERVAEAPVWSVGDAWYVVSTGGGETRRSALVVTAADAGGYTIATTDETVAVYDALSDVSYLGRIRASDLAGQQGETPVQFFSFPLTDGKSWTTTWDGRTIALTARWEDAIVTSAGIHSGFVILGKDGQTDYVEYDFVPELRWWSRLSFTGGYSFAVERVLSGWSGDVAKASVTVLLDKSDLAPVGGPHVESFTVAQGQAALSVRFEGSASYYARGFALVQPDHQAYPSNAPPFTLAEGHALIEERPPPTPGEWRLAAPTIHPAEGAFRLLVRQVQVAPVAFP